MGSMSGTSALPTPISLNLRTEGTRRLSKDETALL